MREVGRYVSRAIVLSAAGGASSTSPSPAYSGCAQGRRRAARNSAWRRGRRCVGAGGGQLPFALCQVGAVFAPPRRAHSVRRFSCRFSYRVFADGDAGQGRRGVEGVPACARAHGMPMARTAPTVVAERLTDLSRWWLLALVGVGRAGGGERVVLWVAVGLVGVCWWRWRRSTLAHSLIDLGGASCRSSASWRPSCASSTTPPRVLLRPTPLMLATLLVDRGVGCASASRSGWCCAAFPAPKRRSKLCTFIYADDDHRRRAVVFARRARRAGGRHGGAPRVDRRNGVTSATAAAATFITRFARCGSPSRSAWWRWPASVGRWTSAT